MKRLLLSIFLLCLLAPASICAQGTDNLFPLPKVPDENMNLTERCNFMVYNFWKECPMKRAFSSMGKLDESFGQWAALMPYATADTVLMSIDNFIARVEKDAPKNMADVGQMARRWFYCDSAAFPSEQLYLPFCKAAADNKKVPSAQRAQFQAERQVLESSMLGAVAPSFEFITPAGEKKSFGDVRASRVILFFNDPDCTDCALAKARFAADYNLNKMIEAGLVRLVSIYPGEWSKEWADEAAAYPANWVVGAFADADAYFSMDEMPYIYYLDGRHKILGKQIPVDNILYVVRQLNTQQ